MDSTITTLADLGPRTIILGPSNSGKSTLADAIARTNGAKPVHLDQLRFQPDSDWVMRPDEEFVALHDEAIKEEAWVMDGNYSICLPQRLQRATGVILIETSTLTSLKRYFYRTLFQKDRVGALHSKKDSVKWEMIRFIIVDIPKNRKKWAKNYTTYTLPKAYLANTKELDAFYKQMNITWAGCAH